MISATLQGDDNPGCFTIMYHETATDTTEIVNIKWYSSIFETSNEYHILHPDGCFKEIFIENHVCQVFVDETSNGYHILHIPNDIESINFCIQKWIETYDINIDYFSKN